MFRFGFLHGIQALNNQVTTDMNPVLRRELPAAYRRRMTPLQARLVLSQLANVDRHIRARIERAVAYDEGLRDVPEVLRPPLRQDGSHTYTYYPIQVEDRVALLHMRDHAAEAVALARRRSRDDLDSDRMLALALTRLVEVIGEAAGRVSAETQRGQGDIPWRQIIGTRNRLIHAYDQVDLDILWRIVCSELPPMIERLDAILQGFANGDT